MPANAIRGIGRWTTEFILALVRAEPQLIAAISIDPVLPLPVVLNLLPTELAVLTTDEAPVASDGERLLFHAFSVMEDLELDRIWPRWARDPAVGLVATVYDMIPALFPDEYFSGPLKHLLTARYEFLRQADALLAISGSTAHDVERLLTIDRHRVFVAYGAVGAQFVPHPLGRDGACAELAMRMALRPGFLLSIGNVDPRKNVHRLLRAYAILPSSLRRAHQLVITCSQGDLRHLDGVRAAAADLGIGDDVVITAFVDNATMVRLYQGCHAMVFPSLYEGLGLPIIEAMRCGAATLASDLGPMREIISDPEARFDPADVRSIGASILRVLNDNAFAEQRRAASISDTAKFNWSTSVESAVRAYQFAADQGR